MSTPFTQHLKPSRWEWQVAALSLVLGSMIYLAWIGKDVRESRTARLDPDLRSRLFAGDLAVDELEKLSKEVAKLRADNTKLQNAVANNSKESKLLNTSLQETKFFAGLTEVEGPGVTVILMDSRKDDIPEMMRIIHDYDVLRVVNELWATGAEAIEVNGNRIAGSSAIRCSGPVIHVDGNPISSPIKVRAIGAQDTMMGGLELPGGFLAELREVDPEMVRIERVKLHRFTAFSSSTMPKHARLPKEPK